MASINASTSGAGGLITTADNTGILQLQSGGTTIATISSTGLQQNVGAPAFSATASSLQVISTGTATKVLYASEDFDTNNNFSSSRFTPTVAGYYQFNYNLVASNAASVAECWIAIYKNGSNWQWGLDVNSITTHYWTVNGSALIYCNGSTDYVEVYFQQGTSGNLDVNPASSLPMRFSGFLARSA